MGFRNGSSATLLTNSSTLVWLDGASARIESFGRSFRYPILHRRLCVCVVSLSGISEVLERSSKPLILMLCLRRVPFLTCVCGGREGVGHGGQSEHALVRQKSRA
uniref:Uncharacterized protein n=1 Tax=Ixodes ricinus TaxID=34613 RepID=A0A6B0UGG1_IXORI